MPELTPMQTASRRFGVFMLAVVGVAGVQWKYNIVPTRVSHEASVPLRVDLPGESPIASRTGAVSLLPMPGNATAKIGGPLVRINIWAWNAQMGLIYANGGPNTTIGSLMEKEGVRVHLSRQDDTEKSKAEQIKFAQLVANGDGNPSEGVHFVNIMGDGAAQYLAGINKAVAKLGADYRAEIVGALGYSRGEDVFMGPVDWKDTPESAKGGVVSGVLRDGDWNIAQYWLAQNGIRNNPDEKTYDPAALNWVAADDYLKAAEMYISGYCEDRAVVRDGKRTTDKQKVCVQGVVTWTPGDVNVAKKKGGLVRILSTKENAYQMPAVMIGIHKWNTTHAKQVEAILAAAFAGGDQVRTFDEALQRAGKASHAIYAEETPAYWVKYYKGVVEKDKTGVPIQLGGSSVANLGDNLVLFGLAEGAGDVSSSLFKATYEGFGNIAKQQYPSLIPTFPATRQAFNAQFLTTLSAKLGPSKPDLPTFEAGEIPVSNQIARRNYSITFDTGKATFTPEAAAVLDDLFTKLSVNSLSVEIDGHTDNIGDPARNVTLSRQRAEAVRAYLQTKAPTLFPENRVEVAAFGDRKPIAPNTTVEGRAANRRVTIILGTK